MGEGCIACHPLVSLPKIRRENACAENELVCVVNELLAWVRRGAGVGIFNCVVDLPPDDLDGVSGGVILAEMIVVCNPVGVCDDHIRRINVGEHIQSSGSAVSQVQPVEDTDEVFLDGAQKLLAEGAVHVLEHVEGNRCCVVGISYARRFQSGGACRDAGRWSIIGWVHGQCRQEGCLYSGGEG